MKYKNLHGLHEKQIDPTDQRTGPREAVETAIEQSKDRMAQFGNSLQRRRRIDKDRQKLPCEDQPSPA